MKQKEEGTEGKRARRKKRKDIKREKEYAGEFVTVLHLVSLKTGPEAEGHGDTHLKTALRALFSWNSSLGHREREGHRMRENNRAKVLGLTRR